MLTAYIVFCTACLVLFCSWDKHRGNDITRGDFLIYVGMAVIPVSNFVALAICIQDMMDKSGWLQKKLF